MGPHRRRREARFAIVLLAGFGVGPGCAQTREIFYPHVPRRAARVRPVPKARDPAPAVGARVREAPKARPIVQVE
jgi:hypothetical protein